MIANGLTELIGNTPLIRFALLEKKLGLRAELYGKAECFNPYSVKDRAALYMIEGAERAGKLKGGVIVEPTSGNTGIGLAFVGRVKGYRVILTMPETMSTERRTLLKRLGAELVLTDGKLGMKGAIARANELKDELGAFMPDQFSNEDNARAHYETTAKELLADLGQVDVFVAGVGTGGTISGVGKRLKPTGTRMVAVEPARSPVLGGGTPGPHGIQGIGAGFVPALFDASLVDEIVTVADEEAYAALKLMADTEGLLAGISSGAALSAALKYAADENYAGKRIVAFLPDGGEKYLSIEY